MTLHDRLTAIGTEKGLRWLSIEEMLTITRRVLCALGDDLIENEREATDTINCLVDAVAALPRSADDVMATDYRRALAREKQPKPS